MKTFIAILIFITLIGGIIVDCKSVNANDNKCEIEFVNHCTGRTFWGIVKFKLDEKGEIVDYEDVTHAARIDDERKTLYLDPDSLYGVTYAEDAMFYNNPIVKIIDYFHFKTKKLCVGTKTVVELGEYLQCQKNETETF